MMVEINSSLHNSWVREDIIARNPLPFILLSAIIGIPSLVVYSVEVWIMLFGKTRRQFKTSFYRLFWIRYIPNAINVVTHYVVYRLGFIGAFIWIAASLPEYALNILYFIPYYTFHMDNILNVVILCNRLTAILLPLRHRKIWLWLVPILSMVSVVIPLILTFHIFCDRFALVSYDHGTAYIIDYAVNSGDKSRASRVSTLSAAISLVVCILLNIITIVSIKRSVPNLTESEKLEIRLTIYAMITCGGQMLMTLYQILVYLTVHFDRYDLLSMVIQQHPWLNDFCTIATPAWSLLWASSQMRFELHHLIGGTSPTSLVLPNSLKTSSSIRDSTKGARALFNTPRRAVFPTNMNTI